MLSQHWFYPWASSCNNHRCVNIHDDQCRQQKNLHFVVSFSFSIFGPRKSSNLFSACLSAVARVAFARHRVSVIQTDSIFDVACGESVLIGHRLTTYEPGGLAGNWERPLSMQQLNWPQPFVLIGQCFWLRSSYVAFASTTLLLQLLLMSVVFTNLYQDSCPKNKIP
jgi:hypothetical protein